VLESGWNCFAARVLFGQAYGGANSIAQQALLNVRTVTAFNGQVRLCLCGVAA
jgi:hypothetical protein